MNDCLFEPTQLDRIEAKLDQLLAKKKPRVTGTPQKRKEYDPEFEKVWKKYPRRATPPSKWDAWKQWKARTNDPNKSARHGKIKKIYRGLELYSKHCDASGKTGTNYVLDAKTFFGPSEHYMRQWDIPAPEEKKPRTEQEWIAYGARKGIEPRAGESMADFQHRIPR